MSIVISTHCISGICIPRRFSENTPKNRQHTCSGPSSAASKSTNMGFVASKKNSPVFCLESGGSFFLKPYPQRKKLQEWRGGLRHCGRGRPLLGGANAGFHRGDARGICRRPCLQQVCPLRPPMRPRGMPHSAQLAGAAAEPARALSRSSCRAQATRRDSGSATSR